MKTRSPGSLTRRPAAHRLLPVVLLPLVLLLVTAGAAGCRPERAAEPPRPVPADLERHCAEAVGEPRVIEVTPNLLVAVGFDLANTILVRTPAGHVVVDAGMSPARAAAARAALLARAPGEVHALILTHSHIDHVGGASEWAGPETPVWVTHRFLDHFLKQYGLFFPAESARGARQFGRHVEEDQLRCSALGRRPDFDGAAGGTGVRLPTRTFSGAEVIVAGGVELHLREAPGETHDQLFVWIPRDEAILSGDNLYESFPNLYTIRGTSPRPVDGWIDSLDRMRALDPAHLVPSHNRPISGREQVRHVLTDYRDAIQWVRDETVRGANAGEPIDQLAQRIRLPPHLAQSPWLRELYGQVEWSVRAIYGAQLGWFDGRPETLYPAAPVSAARREIALMGGPDRVAEAARVAREGGDHRFALHLWAKLRDAGVVSAGGERTDEALAASLRGVAAGVPNSNGRGYLLQSALELERGGPERARLRPADEVLAGIPLRTFLQLMAVRLLPGSAGDVHESVRFVFPDENARFTLTVRRGVAEVVDGDPLPGTPAPLATLTTSGLVWRRLATGSDSALGAILTGELAVEGSRTGLVAFLRRFNREP